MLVPVQPVSVYLVSVKADGQVTLTVQVAPTEAAVMHPDTPRLACTPESNVPVFSSALPLNSRMSLVLLDRSKFPQLL